MTNTPPTAQIINTKNNPTRKGNSRKWGKWILGACALTITAVLAGVTNSFKALKENILANDAIYGTAKHPTYKMRDDRDKHSAKIYRLPWIDHLADIATKNPKWITREEANQVIEMITKLKLISLEFDREAERQNRKFLNKYGSPVKVAKDAFKAAFGQPLPAQLTINEDTIPSEEVSLIYSPLDNAMHINPNLSFVEKVVHTLHGMAHAVIRIDEDWMRKHIFYSMLSLKAPFSVRVMEEAAAIAGCGALIQFIEDPELRTLCQKYYLLNLASLMNECGRNLFRKGEGLPIREEAKMHALAAVVAYITFMQSHSLIDAFHLLSRIGRLEDLPPEISRQMLRITTGLIIAGDVTERVKGLPECLSAKICNL